MLSRISGILYISLILAASPAQAQDALEIKIAQARGQTPAPTAAAEGEQDRSSRVNNWTVGVASGALEGTFIRFGADLGKALDDGERLRILPIVTYGAGENISDLLYLKGVDIAITDADVFEEYKKNNAFGNIEKRINYISEMYIAEFHVLARPEIKSLKDLDGKKVGFNVKGSAANITGKIVFERLGIKVQPVFINNSFGLEQMRTGEMAAIIHTVGKPNDLFKKETGESGFHFLTTPYDSKFSDYYVPTTLSSEDYPSLIKAGEAIETIGVPVVLAVYNWQPTSDRFRRVERFIQYYFERFESMRKPPYHAKWKEINLAAKVPGWTRYWVAEDMINKMASADSSRALTASTSSATSSIGGNGKSNETDPVYREFLEWRKKQQK
jgi:TRAP-type uncharacterized transport system substrate-binding protein